MSSSVEILKKRLAAGEISLSEYETILTHLKVGSGSSITLEGTKEVVQQGALIVGKTTAGLFNAVFGTYSYNEPSDRAPFEVDSTFKIFGTYFEHKGQKYALSDVKSIGLRAQHTSINLVATNYSKLSITTVSGKTIELVGRALIIKGSTNKKIAVANTILCASTFEARADRYLRKLDEQGYFEVDGVRITADGRLLKGTSSVLIRLAHARGYLALGTFSGVSNQDPYQIIAGESGIGIFSERIRFSVIFDRDVIFAIIRRFAGMD